MRLILGVVFIFSLFAFFSSAAAIPAPGGEPWSSTQWPSDVGSAGCLFFYCAVEGQPAVSPEPPTYSEFDMISVCPQSIAGLGLTKDETENKLSEEYGYEKTCWFVGYCEKSASCDCCDFSDTGKRCPATTREKQKCSAGNTGEQCSLTLDCLTKWRRCTGDPVSNPILSDYLPGSCKEVAVLDYLKDPASEYNCVSDYDCVKKDCIYRDVDLSVQGTCQLVYGVGADECSSDSDCKRQHGVCVDAGANLLNKCAFVEGPGVDECTDWSDCNRKACRFGKTAVCMDRKGKEYQPGEVPCETNADCERSRRLSPAPGETLWDSYGWWSLAMVVVVIGAYFAITNFFMQRKSERKRR